MGIRPELGEKGIQKGMLRDASQVLATGGTTIIILLDS
jgi:hypothetical protein